MAKKFDELRSGMTPEAQAMKEPLHYSDGRKDHNSQMFHQKIKQASAQRITNCSKKSRGDKKWVSV